MAQGECNCGEVAFEIDADLPGVVVCHCSICRRATGANGIAVIVVGKDSFRWTRGREQVTTWKKPGADWQIGFCRVCGSPLPGENDALRMFVPVGLITEGGENLDVTHHIFVDSKASWDVIGDGGQQHPEAFSGGTTGS